MVENITSGLNLAMDEKEKKAISRRQLIGGMGKLAYVVPTLTVLTMVSNNAAGFSPPDPPIPSQPGGDKPQRPRRD